MLWMSPCSVVGDKWCRFCSADVIQQPQGPTSPPVSVSWRMHSLCPVLDRWLVCVCVRVVVNVCFILSINVKSLLGDFSHPLPTCFPIFKFQKPEHISVQKQLDLSSLQQLWGLLFTLVTALLIIFYPQYAQREGGMYLCWQWTTFPLQ